MNPETKQFEPIPDPIPPEDPRSLWRQFRLGAIVVIDGLPFRVRKITKKDLVLRPK